MEEAICHPLSSFLSFWESFSFKSQIIEVSKPAAEARFLHRTLALKHLQKVKKRCLLGSSGGANKKGECHPTASGGRRQEMRHGTDWLPVPVLALLISQQHFWAHKKWCQTQPIPRRRQRRECIEGMRDVGIDFARGALTATKSSAVGLQFKLKLHFTHCQSNQSVVMVTLKRRAAAFTKGISQFPPNSQSLPFSSSLPLYQFPKIAVGNPIKMDEEIQQKISM
jgi:hypothetical protein